MIRSERDLARHTLASRVTSAEELRDLFDMLDLWPERDDAIVLSDVSDVFNMHTQDKPKNIRSRNWRKD